MHNDIFFVKSKYSVYSNIVAKQMYHDDVIKWKRFPRYWSFVQEIHRSPVNSSNKGQRRTRNFDVCVDLRLRKRLSKHSGYLWFANFDVTAMYEGTIAPVAHLSLKICEKKTCSVHELLIHLLLRKTSHFTNTDYVQNKIWRNPSEQAYHTTFDSVSPRICSRLGGGCDCSCDFIDSREWSTHSCQPARARSLTQINWLEHGYVITTWLFAQCNR